ncbi:hypothetical protein MTR67_043094 [Solanum verrucosum]|uniref:ATP-dependent helicase C-terminal domain-containing protein n=1 Tax=Solanum verrucosum TaxID=315347 RepID=A0AAF0UR51_SOLVR|nr:hypothetical protein MTR67_043094 [Solanum verrucosum]
MLRWLIWNSLSIRDDLRFKLKMMFNNAYASYSVQLLRLNIDLVKGEDWYNIQAFKALNQAAGRCIRPRHDYGAFIFIDERFSEKSQRDHLSDWFKETVINYSRYEDAIEKVSHFFNAQNG